MTRLSEREFAEFLRDNPKATYIDFTNQGAAPEQRPAPALKPQAPTEHDDQVALFQWAAANIAQHPELDLMYAVPNGGYRHPATAAMLKAEGVRAGVPDIFLPAPRHHWHGLYIEMKRSDYSNNPTAEQAIWINRLRQQGYCVAVCYGFDAAVKALTQYLEGYTE